MALTRKCITQLNIVCKACNSKLYMGMTCIDHSFMYNKLEIFNKSINVFNSKKRSKNDENNKDRENIIAAIINDVIPTCYYRYDKWAELKANIDTYVLELCSNKNINIVDDIKCIPKAGRGNHYDFIFKINKEFEFKIEFKYNASCIDDAPQFVSPMRPSQYLSNSFEEYYYNNYLCQLLKKFDMEIPEINEYLKTIHSPKPKCMLKPSERYARGYSRGSKFTDDPFDIEFYNEFSKMSDECITNFIMITELDKDKLSEYLINTQKDKHYMLYKDSKFYYEKANLDNYIIINIKKDPENKRYIAETKSGKTLKILLRWKNGKGIAFPSFQIS